MQIGYFNSDALAAEPNPERRLATSPSSIGAFVEGSAPDGKRFMPQITGPEGAFTYNQEIRFRATKEPRAFEFRYDPKANNGVGRMTIVMDGETSSLDLTPQQRTAGAQFDRFGIANLRGGGKYVVVYFDDLTYTARRPQNYESVFREQKVVKVPYPEGGRAF
jgi:hypothetical protein